MGEMKDEIIMAVARGWCHDETSHKTMDADLAMAISEEVLCITAKLEANNDELMEEKDEWRDEAKEHRATIERLDAKDQAKDKALQQCYDVLNKLDEYDNVTEMAMDVDDALKIAEPFIGKEKDE